MSAPQTSIFREKALERYQRTQEQGVMLRVSCPSALTFLWLFLLILAGLLAFAWSVQLPVQLQSQGMIIQQKSEIVAVLFLVSGERTMLRAGQSATVSIGAGQYTLPGKVERVETTLISPDEARRRFNLQGGLAQIVTEPSIVVTLAIGPAASAQVYVGSLCAAQIQVGSQSVLSSLPGLRQFFSR